MHILITGGAGYIGSHTALQFMKRSDIVTIFDNLYNSSTIALERIATLAESPINFIEGDILDSKALNTLFTKFRFDAVVHFAGLKAVGESMAQPLKYYQNNVAGTLNLLQEMQQANIKTLIFSSSATVYGETQSLPITETSPVKPANPYGRSKSMVEQVLADLYDSDSEWRIACLRYFNPVGAHPSGYIGENPNGTPNNLMPFISQVATGLREYLSVFGNDYKTPDGTGVRDYIHVMDLAQGHLAALEYLMTLPNGQLLTLNLGRGQGHSVLEVIKAFEKASGVSIPYKFVDRRPGDVANCYADPSRAEKLLNWKAARGIDEMCADTWHWQSNNPQGYRN